MKRLIAVILIVVSGLCYGAEKDGSRYISRVHGFSIEIPKWWDGKYTVEEYKDGITVYYKKGRKKIGLFDIAVWGKADDWNKMSEEERDDIPSKKIGEIAGTVYVWPWAVYEGELEIGKESEYKKMYGEVEKTLESFRETDKKGEK